MRIVKDLGSYIIAVILISLTLSACGKENRETENRETENPEVRVSAAGDFYQEAKRSGKMEFGSMKVSKTVTTERTAWYKVGSRIAVYSFDIWLRAYVDLDKISEEDIEIDEDRKIIYVTLPPIEIEIAGRSPELRKEYEHIGIFRSHPDSRERAELKEIANADFEKEYKSDPEYVKRLRQTASGKARQWFSALGEARGYTVEFRQPLKVERLE